MYGDYSFRPSLPPSLLPSVFPPTLFISLKFSLLSPVHPLLNPSTYLQNEYHWHTFLRLPVIPALSTVLQLNTEEYTIRMKLDGYG